ncbi:ribonuclease H [Nocardia fluminea]|jgi:ribonuclease HI|uniref:ribonuclease H family protein n=1 Tax=Nocardia fluminea TaxID=134984 RepID=UPI00341DDB51
MIIVSTDGSCLRNPGGAIGWAWVNHSGPADSGGAASGTNQIAELRGVLEAILAHPGAEPMLIESDSQYAIKCASEWITSWRRNGWRTSTGGAVKNVEIIKQIDRAITGREGPVRFRWVRGHVGNYFNEQADKLAGEAARAIREGVLVPTAPAAPEPVLGRLDSGLTRGCDEGVPAGREESRLRGREPAAPAAQNTVSTGKSVAAEVPVTGTLTLF